MPYSVTGMVSDEILTGMEIAADVCLPVCVCQYGLVCPPLRQVLLAAVLCWCFRHHLLDYAGRLGRAYTRVSAKIMYHISQLTKTPIDGSSG